MFIRFRIGIGIGIRILCGSWFVGDADDIVDGCVEGDEVLYMLSDVLAPANGICGSVDGVLYHP
jgi:hypothetical protein